MNKQPPSTGGVDACLVILAFGLLKAEDQNFQVGLGYITRPCHSDPSSQKSTDALL